MITVATLFWQANAASKPFSSMYDESWVEKLYRGFARNLTQRFRFICYVDRPRVFAEPIAQRQIANPKPSYADCIQPFEMGEPMILVGLDTVITGNIDHLAEWTLTSDKLALPRDPYNKAQACNGVCLVPGGMSDIATKHRGENDMEWLRTFPHDFIDDLFPGHVQSFKGTVRDRGLGDTRVCYFHGREKPHELPAGHPVLEHWR
ncbi:MAG: hypothetical protein ACK4RV_10250 [Caulobacter sp.]